MSLRLFFVLLFPFSVLPVYSAIVQSPLNSVRRASSVMSMHRSESLSENSDIAFERCLSVHMGNALSSALMKRMTYMSSGNFAFTWAKQETRFLKRTMNAVIELKCSYRMELISLKYECFRLCPCPSYWQRNKLIKGVKSLICLLS